MFSIRNAAENILWEIDKKVLSPASYIDLFLVSNFR